MLPTLPALFLGHGSPMNAIQTNPYTEGWRRIGESIPAPKAVLCISAHWYLRQTAVTIAPQPRTIHDFGGFPPQLYAVRYPAPGDVSLAARVRELLAPEAVEFDQQWGFDHGAWSVLMHVYPAANIPVVQLSINASKPAAWHFEMGKRLAALRQEGVLIVGSGNLVHNLRTYLWGQQSQQPFDWAQRFEEVARAAMTAADWPLLIGYERWGQDAQLSVPTPEHFLPLLYVLGSANQAERPRFPIEGFDGGSISMLSVQVGG
jgi:4,5-DOPA dioxygenase extradiol